MTEFENLFLPGLLTPCKYEPGLPVVTKTSSLSMSPEIPPQGFPPE